MCGIFGFFSNSAPLGMEADSWASAAIRALSHRGPDGHGAVRRLNDRCILGHTRLSIIDVDGGAQPLSNEDGTVWVTLNGEIYNYIELREQLLRAGHTFRTNSDTEVLVHLYEEKGIALLDDLVGMYAFGLLDERTGKLFLARDRFGEKPLYYTRFRDGQTWAFASELKALRELPGVDLAFDVKAVTQFLAMGYVPAPRTQYAGIRKLRSAEWMCLGDSEPTPRRYWSVQFTGDDRRPTAALVEELRARLTDSVRLRLRSDVPLGAFLSGGIDSSLVVTAMRQNLPGATLRTYCAGFDNEVLDESAFASEVATFVGAQHRTLHVGEAEMLEDFDRLILHYDEPFADYSMYPTLAVCRAARKEVTVILSGDGADECFGGYHGHYAYGKWQGVRHSPGVNALARWLHSSWPTGRSGSGILEYLAQNDLQLLNGFRQQQWALQLMRPEWRAQANEGIEEINDRMGQHLASRYPLSAMESQLTDFYLPDQILVKVDRASMNVALESRAPFLDHRLVEFAARIPASQHVRNGMGKQLLRQALPEGISDRIRWRKKRGFTPPLAQWFRGELRPRLEEVVDRPPEILADLADPTSLSQTFREHMKGADRQDLLFRWLVLARQLEGSSNSVRPATQSESVAG